MAEINHLDQDRLAFHGMAEEGFRRACDSVGGATIKHFRIAGRTVQMRFAGDALIPKLTSAISHLETETAGESELTIHLFDSVSTNTPLPLMLSSLVDLLRLRWFERLGIRKEINDFHSELIRTIFHLGPDILSTYNTETRSAVYWINGVEDIPYYEEGYPLTPILSWWLEQKGFQLIHAASVGTEKGGAIICGKGGSGKSSTALSCINSRLKFLGDDYCIVDTSDPENPRIWSLYSTSKLKGPDDIARFPRFRNLISNLDKLDDEKALLFLNDHLPECLLESFPLKTIFVPRITGLPDTSISAISSIAALRALAPSTMFQLPGDGPASFKRMSNLVKIAECRHLDLGTSIEGIPDSIADFLNSLNE
jgi:hypothetical protein